MNKRIFIAINLPEKTKKALAEKHNPDVPARWTSQNNLHITLAFLGSLNDQEIYQVSKAVKETAKKNGPFEIILEKICYGPIGKMPPRMVWAMAGKSKEFSDLKNSLEKELSLGLNYSPEPRQFSPHITLARIGQWQWKRIEPEERPEVEEDIHLPFSVNSIEIMESNLKRGGAQYSIFESYGLEG